MAFIGMDPAVVRNVGIQLKTQADQLGAIIAAVDGLVGRTQAAWRGADAQQFEGWWKGQHRPALHAAQVAVDGLGQSALNNADAQLTTSSAAGSSSTDGGAPARPTGAFAVGAPVESPSAVRGLADDAAGVYAGVGYAAAGASLFSLVRHHGSLKSLPWSKISVRGVAALLHNGEHATAELRPLTRFLGPIDIGVNSVRALDDIVTGASATQQLKDVGSLGVSGLTFAVPELALPAAAATTGWLVGTEVAQIPAVHRQLTRWSDDAYGQALANAGGDALAIGNRYDGVSGFWHFTEDSAQSGWHKFTGLF